MPKTIVTSRVLKGRGYKDAGKLVEQPMDLVVKTDFALGFRGAIAAGDTAGVPKTQQFQLTEADYNFVRHWMSRPPESTSPNYSSNE